MAWLYKRIFIGVLIVHVVVLAALGVRCSRQAEKAAQAQGDAGEAPADLDALPVLGEEPPVASVGASSSAALAAKPKPLSPVAAPPEQPFAFRRDQVLELPASIVSSEARSGILVELPSGRVIWEKNPKLSVHIASMTKMMTALLAFESVEVREDLTMDTVVQVTKAAYKMGGSQVWLDPRESFPLRELMISIMVKSANDSAYLVGEFLAGGSMPAFVERMNGRALQLGMTGARFLNAHGLSESDGSGNEANCFDLVLLARQLLLHDEAKQWSSIKQYSFRPEAETPTLLTNHNRLVSTCPGVDGLKTGYTKEAGYCTTVTCERGGRRLVAVANGFTSAKARDAFVTQLLEWGYRQP